MTRLLSLIILVTMTVQMAFAKISFSTELLNSANQGNVEAQYDLALCYYYGYGCNVDYESAFKWFDGSAQKGYYPAIYALSICYEKGHGCIRNQKIPIFKFSEWQNANIWNLCRFIWRRLLRRRASDSRWHWSSIPMCGHLGEW